jgi:acyl carrier protein phosphodiesterase
LNYLAHAYLSFDHPDLLVGNMIGDYIKGNEALAALPEGIQKGVKLHRLIDSYTDMHPSIAKCKTYFREDYRLYAGAFVDAMFDHFIANDPQCFESEKHLLDFTQKTYQHIEQHINILPVKFQSVFPYMKAENWLYHYRTLKGMEKSFGGLVRRAQYLNRDEQSAFRTLVTNFYTLNQFYYEFIDDVKAYVNKEIIAIQS